MRMVGALFPALCMLIVAGLAGAAVHLFLGLGMREAAAATAAILALLALCHTASSRVGLRSALSRQLADLSRGGADVGRQVAEIERRLAALESRFEAVLDQARSVIDPLSLQVSELDTSVKGLAETVRTHQTALDAIAGPASEQPAKAAASPAPKAREPLADSAGEKNVAPGKELSLETIRGAIDASRIELYLQPIVILPRRKVCFYEATSRLRTESGENLHESEFFPQAQRGGLMPKIDYLVIFRSVQIVRRLLMKNREIGVFCSLSRGALADADFSQQVHDFMAANRAIASSLVLQFTQNAVHELAESEYARLAALSQLGFRFCLHQVTSLRLEPEKLAPRGFRYVKLHTPLLLGRAALAPAQGGPAELSELLGRFGMDLIVDEIVNESSVMELLDHDVRYGQGPLFSAPRPVRAVALQTAPNPSDAAVEGISVQTHPSLAGAAPHGHSPRAETVATEAGSDAQLSVGALRLG